jgi:5'-methylthioadenosine phosphorylase
MLALIGGTGLYSLEGLEINRRHSVQTPFGKPSAEIIEGNYRGTPVLFLPRHGLHHELLPSEIPFRANVYALKACGATGIVSVSASGSLDERYAPGSMGLVSQYIDWTRGKRALTFFGEGLVGHISSAQPACPILSQAVVAAAERLDIPLHTHLTYGCVEGPRLGTRAESVFFKQSGCDILGMTNVPEAFLALEAQLPYVTIAIITDYDCWLDDPTKHASAHEVVQLYKNNLGKIQHLLGALLENPPSLEQSPSRTSLKYAVMTQESFLGVAQKELLAFLRK